MPNQKNSLKLSSKELEEIATTPILLGHALGYDKLNDTHNQWIIDCWNRSDDFSLQAHRNSYKTTAILVVGSIWWLTFINPDETILILRKSWTEAVNIIREIRHQFISSAMKYILWCLYDKTKIDGKPWSDSELNLSIRKKVSKEPNLSASGMTGNITGAHYSKIFCDDFVTIKDRVSAAERHNSEIFLHELNNIAKLDGNKVFSGTPWHKNDAWSLCPKPVQYPLGSIDIPELTTEKIDSLKKQGRSLFAANYKLEHVADEDQLFLEPREDEWPHEQIITCQAWIDPAFTGAATVAMSIIGLTITGQAYITGFVWENHIINCYDAIIYQATKYQVGTINIEINKDEGASERELKSKWPSVNGYRESMNKHIKILTYLKPVWMDFICDKDCDPNWKNQILDYNEFAELKDAPDSAAALAREMKLGKDNQIMSDLRGAVRNRSKVAAVV